MNSTYGTRHCDYGPRDIRTPKAKNIASTVSYASRRHVNRCWRRATSHWHPRIEYRFWHTLPEIGTLPCITLTSHPQTALTVATEPPAVLWCSPTRSSKIPLSFRNLRVLSIAYLPPMSVTLATWVVTRMQTSIFRTGWMYRRLSSALLKDSIGESKMIILNTSLYGRYLFA